jgi:serine/threonine protein kinase
MLESTPMQSSIPDATACGEGALLGGKYRLRRLLGEGGMGNVWLADNELLELPVAIKIMRPEVRCCEAGARFLTEARVQAKLRHPNVVRVFDYGETAAGDAYIVMELLEGCSLADRLDTQGGFEPVSAVQLMLPVIDALCAAHRAGVIHRDLKPDNIFLVTSGEQLCPKLLDFGIAKLETEVEPRLTNPQGLIGSPAYMAPEQARGLDDVDQRADIWAACVVLYECITGKPAYDAANYQALLRTVIERDLPPLDVPGTEDLWPILRAGLMRERADRTTSMHELGLALAGWLVSVGEYDDVSREPLGWRWSAVSRIDDVFEVPEVSPAILRGRRSSRAHQRALAEALQRTGVATLLAPTPAEVGGLVKWLRTARPSAAVRLGVASAFGAGILVFGMGLFGMGQAEQDGPHERELAHAVQLVSSPAAIAAAEAPKARDPQPLAATLGAPHPTAVHTAAPAPVVAPAPQAVEAPPRAPRPAPSAKPVLTVKRRVPATEAELGLKNPW